MTRYKKGQNSGAGATAATASSSSTMHASNPPAHSPTGRSESHPVFDPNSLAVLSASLRNSEKSSNSSFSNALLGLGALRDSPRAEVAMAVAFLERGIDTDDAYDADFEPDEEELDPGYESEVSDVEVHEDGQVFHEAVITISEPSSPVVKSEADEEDEASDADFEPDEDELDPGYESEVSDIEVHEDGQIFYEPVITISSAPSSPVAIDPISPAPSPTLSQATLPLHSIPQYVSDIDSDVSSVTFSDCEGEWDYDDDAEEIGVNVKEEPDYNGKDDHEDFGVKVKEELASDDEGMRVVCRRAPVIGVKREQEEIKDEDEEEARRDVKRIRQWNGEEEDWAPSDCRCGGCW